MSGLTFMLMDEPTNHLDADRKEEFIEVLKELRNVPQLIIVDHEPKLIEAGDIRYKVSLEKGYSVITTA